MQKKIQNFLDKETKHLSKSCPFLLNLFKDGIRDENVAGLRLSEGIKQFPSLGKFPGEGLSGLLFYYQLNRRAQRVPHWHANAFEVGVVLAGKMKITIWDGSKKPSIFTVPKKGAWMIPQGTIHCLENASDERLDFLVSYNSPVAEDRDFSTAWSSLPSDILALSVGLSEGEIATFKKHPNNRLSLFDPGDMIDEKDLPGEYRALFSDTKPLVEGSLGSIHRLDGHNWKANQTMALQQTVMKPGAVREPHWYRGSDTFLFVTRGKAYFNMMVGEGNVYNILIKEGDLLFIPEGAFHTFINVGNEDLEVYEAFMHAGPFSEIGIQGATAHFRPGIMAGALDLKLNLIQKVGKTKESIYLRTL